MVRILLLISIAITVYAFVDCARTPQEEVQNFQNGPGYFLLSCSAPRQS